MIQTLINVLYDFNANLPDDRSFYDQVIDEIETDSVSSQVYFLLIERGDFKKTPSSFQARLKQKVQEVLYQNLYIKKETEKLFDRFEEMQVEVIPLKGTYFAENYFGHLGGRSTSDIDILIKEEDIGKVQKIVQQLGFIVEEEHIPDHFHSSFSKNVPGSPAPLTVEIHWNILQEATSNFNINEFWRDAAELEDYQYIKRLSGYHEFYLICLHGWRHNLDSSKYFLDIIQMIHVLQNQLDYNRLFTDARVHQTFKRMRRTLAIVYQEYPMLTHVVALPAYIEQKGASRKKPSKLYPYWDFLEYQFFSYDIRKHSMVEIRHWLLPGRFALAAELGKSSRQGSYVINLLRLYIQRSAHFVKALLPS